MTIETDAAEFGAYGFLEEVRAGLLWGIASRRIESYVAQEIIPMGYPIFGYEGDADDAHLLHIDQGKLVFDADLITDNSISVTVNTLNAVVVFATDHDTTMDLLVTAIEALDSTFICTLDSTDTDNRTLLITTKGATAAVAGVVTLGVSQAGVVVTLQLSEYLVFLGVAIKLDKEPVVNVVTGRGDNYAIGNMVSTLVDGWIWGVTDGGTIVSNTAPKVEATGANISKFTPNASGTGKAVGGYYKGVPVSGDLAVVKVDAQTKIS